MRQRSPKKLIQCNAPASAPAGRVDHKSNGGPDTRRPTLARVAKAAEVSVSTVSAVLNDRPHCWASEATRQRVYDAARRLGYRPNLAARSLRSGLTHTLGLITTALNIANPHNRVNGMHAAAAETGYALMMSFHANDPFLENHLIREHLDRGVDGIAIYTVDGGPHEELRKLVARGFPVVTFDGEGRLDFDCDDISPDYTLAGAIQARHLLDIGCRAICVLNTLPSAKINDIREDGVRMALAAAEAAAPLFMNVRQTGRREISGAEDLYVQILAWIRRRRGEFDAVIAFDSTASLAIRALLEAGLRVPDDVAVIGGGNSMLSEFAILPISSIDTSDDQIGALAFKRLRDRITGKTAPNRFRRHKLKPFLVQRQSTGRPSRD